MDATIQGLRLPEGFAGMLEDNGLPLPPLPLEAINELEQTDEWFFATDGREPLSGLAGLYLEDLDAVFDSPEAPQGVWTPRKATCSNRAKACMPCWI